VNKQLSDVAVTGNSNLQLKHFLPVAVLGWGQGAQPPKSCPGPQIFNWFQGCIEGIYAGICRIPTPGVF